jgi:hypothetical protein
MPQAYFGSLHPLITITKSRITKLYATPRYNPLLYWKKCKALCIFPIFYCIACARHCVSPIYNLKVLLCCKTWINLVEQVQNLRVTTNSQKEVCISLTFRSWILNSHLANSSFLNWLHIFIILEWPSNCKTN